MDTPFNNGRQMSDEEIERLQALHKTYENAFAAEFDVANGNDSNDNDTIIAIKEEVRANLIAEARRAATTIVGLSRHAESETLRFNASKYVIEQGLGQLAASTEKGSTNLKQLLEELTANVD